VIGRIIAAYCEGCRDARRDAKRRRASGESEAARRVYLLGHHDELARMREAGRLAQLELETQTKPEGT
jgi:hypothetical protein